MKTAEYWKERCNLAEQVILYEQPQHSKHLNEWQKFKNEVTEAQSKEESPRWVKASERLPDGKEVCARRGEDIGSMRVFKQDVVFYCYPQSKRYDFSDSELYEYEWLDESKSEITP